MSRTEPKVKGRGRLARLKRGGEMAAIILMLIGVIMVCQPFVHVLFRWGFLVTLAGIVVFTVASNLPERKRDDA